MQNRPIFIISAVVIFIVGFSGGFIITKAFVANPDKSNAVLTSIDQKSSEIEMQNNVKSEDTVPEIKDLPELGQSSHSSVKKETTEQKTSSNDCPKPKKEYEDEFYNDVGQEISLEDKSYIPNALIELDKSISKYDNICIREEVAEALKNMLDTAAKDGHSIIVSSGFRDYNTQYSILSSNIRNGNKDATKLIAKPGYSEHQIGVAVDLTSPSIAYASATQKFGETPESDWLETHASEYGFVESYPKDKENITGYLYEPWHYRYVGIEDAQKIVASGLTPNQYLKNKKESSSP